MTSKFLRFVLAGAVLFAISALAQTSATPASVSSAAPAASAGPGLKVGTINIQDAIFGSNEGRRDMDVLQKKLEPKQNELKSQNDELEAMKKQLNTQASSLNEDALATLKKQIESKQKVFDRALQDFQEDGGNQQQEIATRILSKMAPMIVKFSQDNGFGLIVDTSKPWPQSPVLWWNQDAVDITKPVVDAYNLQSGVPAPAATPAAAKPAAPKPATGTAAAPKPAAPKPTAPQTTQPPQ
ncbi:Outer membrane chaperone Skp (OmpH) [Candidatus Sulfotelmatobacter kueseliae]|uniref:Outer membrane chaperone Skp (OmpH) n=1 Tax=Candidatus Sulfotelmatobacter kueseliae TaxID=2042962 RepID=A0A2U3LAZ1_9BACT|nr:Outer membrane chaperone Skp (OmpH) [Candidatus Sulfotelmatobacter kueseliae]